MRALPILFFSFVASAAFCNLAANDRTTKAPIPTTISFTENNHNYQLFTTGSTTRKKFFVKIYTVTHYMEEPIASYGPSTFEELIDNSQAKQLTIYWQRPLNGKKIEKGYHDALVQTLNRNEFEKIEKTLSLFTKLFAEGAHKSDSHEIRWMPEGSLLVYINGERKEKIDDPAFARAIWQIWFGSRSVVNRNQLIENMEWAALPTPRVDTTNPLQALQE